MATQTTNSPPETPDFGPGVALVVGGSGGLGGIICERLALAGSNVALTYHSNLTAAEAVADKVRQAGREGSTHVLDARDAAAVAALADELAARGRLHTVVDAAGSDIPQARIADLDPDVWRQVFDADVNGFFNIVQATLKHLRDGGGSYVFISSAGLQRWPELDALSVAPKAAIESLLQGIAREEGIHGVRANSVLPGVIDVGIFHRLLNQEDSPFDAAWTKHVQAKLAVKRWGLPEEVADAAVFLASNRALYVTGQSIAVDGGYGI